MGGGKEAVVARRGDSCATWLRTGVKPVRTACSALRARGVAGWWTGTQSAVKPWGGRPSPSSKSSGALRFLPAVLVVAMEGSDDEDAMGIAGIGGTGGAWRGVRFASGVRALKTGGCRDRDSGVLGLGNTEGPEAMRERELGVVGVYVGVGRAGGGCVNRSSLGAEGRGAMAGDDLAGRSA